MFVVGLTGGIASGKTTASDYFAGRGIPVIDADLVARKVVEPGTPGLRALIEEFGPDVLMNDGGLDRAKLRQIVFSDVAKRERLEGVVHPLVHEEIDRQLAALSAPWVILSVPLLVGSPLMALIDRVLVVDVSVEQQKVRLLLRDRNDEQQAEAMIAAQAGRQDRLAIADDVADNSSTPEHFFKQLARLFDKYQTLAKYNSSST